MARSCNLVCSIALPLARFSVVGPTNPYNLKAALGLSREECDEACWKQACEERSTKNQAQRRFPVGLGYFCLTLCRFTRHMPLGKLSRSLLDSGKKYLQQIIWICMTHNTRL